MYQAIGMEEGQDDLFRRALELLEKSLLLLSQNTDPNISELTIYAEMADVYLMLNEGEKAVELLKKQNAGGHYNDRIGLTLTTNMNRPDEALPFVSKALVGNVASLIRTVLANMDIYVKQKNYLSAKEILQWGTKLIEGLTEPEKPNFLVKVQAVIYACLANVFVKTKQPEEGCRYLEKAKQLAAWFDAAASYDVNDIRFVSGIDLASAHDNFGASAMESIENTINSFEDETVTALWKEVRKNGK